jgi:RNA polymerase sigma factor (sigma-70 family)
MACHYVFQFGNLALQIWDFLATQPMDCTVDQLPALVQRAQQGDLDAFAVLVARFQDMAHARAYAVLGDAHLAEDAAQEAFIDAYVSLPRLREAAAFATWFRRIVFKHAERFVRGKQIVFVPLGTAADLPARTLDPATIAVQHELIDLIRHAVAALPAHERDVVVLHYLADAPYAEVAALLGVPLSTVKKRLHDARKRLKQRMNAMVEDEHVQPPSQDDRFTNRVQFLLAVRTGNVARIKSLLDLDPALVNVREEWNEWDEHYYDAPARGWTPLHRVAWQGDAALADVLLAHEADVHAATQSGLTPLHLAAQMGHQTVVEMLLNRGANVNAVMTNGLTPLHWAAMRGHAVVIHLLLAHGAAPDVLGKAGRTPLDWAQCKGHVDVVHVLEAHGIQHPRA